MLRRLYVFGNIWPVVTMPPAFLMVLFGIFFGLGHLIGTGAFLGGTGVVAFFMSGIISEGWNKRCIPQKPLPREERKKLEAEENRIRSEARIRELEKAHGLGEPDQPALEGRVVPRSDGARRVYLGPAEVIDFLDGE